MLFGDISHYRLGKGELTMAKKYMWLLLCIACVICLGCGTMQGNIDFTVSQPENQAQEEQKPASPGVKPLRIAFASVISPIETRKSYQEMVDYIGEKLGQPVVLVQRKTYEELNMLLAGGEADVAFISTGAYTSYNGMIPLELLAMVQTDGTVYYQAYVIVQADSDITDFSQLRGKTFAFTDPLSYSGRLAIDYQLQDEYQTTTESFFQRCFYTYNHDKSIWAVANKLADGAGIDSQIYTFAKKADPDIDSKIRIISVSKPLPTGPVVMRQDLPELTKSKLREILFSMDGDPEMAQAMHKAIIDKFVEPKPGDYDELKHKYQHWAKLPGV